MPDRYADLSLIARRFIETLDDERVVRLTEAADLIRDMPAESRDFLRNADKGTLRWLERASPEDISQLQYSIKFMGASKILGRALWISLVAFAGMALTVVTLWDKVFGKAAR